MPVQNIQGLKGLSKADRQAWEQEQLAAFGESFNEYNEAEKDRIYRNQQFKNYLGDREDYDELIKYTPEERDRIFANVAFKEVFGEQENYEALTKYSPERRDEEYIGKEVFDRAAKRYGKDPYWETLQKLVPSELNKLLEADWKTPAERQKSFEEALKQSRGETYDASAIIYDGIDGATDGDVSGWDVTKAFGKALWDAFNYSTNMRNWGWGATTRMILTFSDSFNENLPGGDSTARRLNARVRAGVSSSLGTIAELPIDAAADAFNWFRSLEVGRDAAGNKVLRTSEKTKNLKSRVKESYKEQPVEEYNEYLNRVHDYMIGDALSRSSDIRTQKAEQLGNKALWEDGLNMMLSSDDAPEVNNMWNVAMSISSYGREFKDTDKLNLTDGEKVDVLSQWRSVADLYGEELAGMTLENTLRNIIAARTTIDERAKNLGINVGCQAAGVIGETVTGVESMVRAGQDANFDLYRQGLRLDKAGDLKLVAAWHNPTYWGSVAQYGTLSPSKIRQYKYGVGSDEYNKKLAEYIEQTKLANPDVEISDSDLEESFMAQWIKQQYDEGKFKGDQISKTVTVRRAEDEGRLFGDQSLAEGIGMAGQMMGQLSWQAPSFIVGKLARAGRIAGKAANVLEKTTAGIGLLAPTIAISEAYAQGNYEQTILKNREALENYIQSDAFREKMAQEISTPEFQQQVTDAYNQKSAYYNQLALAQNPKLSGKDITAFGRQLAEIELSNKYTQDVVNNSLNHIQDGATEAYWTSFGIEAMRYGHFFTTYRQFIFGNATKKLGLNNKTWSIGKGGATNNLTSRAIAKNFGKEALYSGWTNYLDETTSAFATGIGNQVYNDYLGVHYRNNPEYNNSLGHLMSGIHSAGRSFVEDSSIRAGVVGTMGFLTGGNFANVATAWIAPKARTLTAGEIAERLKQGMSLQDASQLSRSEIYNEFAEKLGFNGGVSKYGGGRVALEWLSYLTGNSALQNLTYQLQEADYNKALCREINHRVYEDEQLLNSNETARALFNASLTRQDANESNDELRMKNAAYLQAFEIFKVLHEMRQSGTDETATYQNFMEQMAAYERGEISNDDINMFLNNPLNKEDMSQYTDTEIEAIARERIQKNAVKFRELSESWEKNSAELSNIFGNDIRNQDKAMRDIYYDTLFKMCQQDDMKTRLAGIEESLSGNTEVNTQTNDAVQYAIAKDGTKVKILDTMLKAIHTQIERNDKDIAKLEKDSNKKAAKQNKAELIRLRNQQDRLKQLVHKFSEDKTRLSSLEANTHLLSKDEIMHLSPEERLFMFTSPEAFSTEQQAVIEEARTDLLRQFGDDYLSKLRDTHLLNERIRLTNDHLNTILNGGIGDAILNYNVMQQKNSIEAIHQAANESLHGLLPLLSNDGISSELLSAAAGMPASSISQFADKMKRVNVQQAQALEQLATAIEGISIFDAAIESAGLDDASKKEVSAILANILRNSDNLTDLPKLFMDYVNNPAIPQEGKDLVVKVLNKQVELVKQRESTEKGEQLSTPKESEVKEGSQQSAVEAAELKEADLTTGEFKSLTPDQLAAADPQTFSPAKVPVQPQSDEVMPTNTQGTSMQGNWINAYDVKVLKETGKQVAKRGKADGDSFNRWLQWTADNGIRYQDVVDFELAKILEHNPNMPIHMITINAQENATQDNLIGDAVMLAVEATDAVKRVHNEEYGHYITSRGKEYLIIGRAGVERTATDEQQNTYNNMYNDLKSEATAYFNEHGEERFCVSDKYHTEVRYVNGGSITTALLGEQAATHDITEMLGDAKRDPFGIKKIDNLGWYVQVGDKACEPFGLPSKVVREGRYYTPNNPANNRGAVFVMVPAGNGKFMPVKVTAALLTNIKEGALKRQIQSSLQKVVSPTYNVRQEGIMELLKTLVLNDNTNILIGTQDFNTVTIVNDSQKVSYDLATTPAEELIAAIMQIPFRINVNQSVFLDATKLKQYAEAGVFRTDAAVLGATGNNYSVYTCNTDGTPAKENAPVGNTDYTPSTTEIPSVVFNGNIARYRNGQWVVEDIVNGTRTVTSPAEIQQLNYSWQIIQQGLAPVETDAKTGFNYYIIDSNPNHPIAVKKDNAGKVVVASEEAARKLLEQAERKAKDKAAAAVLQAENDAAAKRGQVINLEEDEVTTPPVEIDNEAAAQKGQLFDLFEDEADTDQAPKVTPTKEKGGDDVTKTLLDLDMSGKSSTFAELFNSADHFEDIYNALVEKFGEENLPSDVSQYEAFLKEHNIPTVVSSAEALIDMIKNCR